MGARLRHPGRGGNRDGLGSRLDSPPPLFYKLAGFGRLAQRESTPFTRVGS